MITHLRRGQPAFLSSSHGSGHILELEKDGVCAHAGARAGGAHTRMRAHAGAEGGVSDMLPYGVSPNTSWWRKPFTRLQSSPEAPRPKQAAAPPVFRSAPTRLWAQSGARAVLSVLMLLDTFLNNL